MFQNKPLVLAPDISRVQLGFIKPRHTAQQIAWVFAGMCRVEHIDLTCTYLGRLSQAQRDAIFSPLGHLKSINLNQVGLSKLDTKSLNAIFCHLGSLESIDLTQNDFFRETYKERIDAVFSHLPQLKTIHIGSNSLKFLDDECLLRLGSYFQNVISLFWVSDLRENVTPKRLEMIFSNLPRLKSIDLSYNDIGSWDEPSLRVLFSSLSQVKWINFISNELSHIPFDLLVSLFSELKEAKLIKVTEGERFFSHLTERLPHLKDSLLYSR